MSQIVDLCFNISGESIPVDHGYFLFSAISSIIPQFHASASIKLAPIRGFYTGNGLLKIEPESKLVLRLPADEIQNVLSLAGKTLNIATFKFHVGLPNARAIVPSDIIYSHFVTTRNGDSEERFIAEITRQMGELERPCKITIVARKTISIHNKQIVGYSTEIRGLSPADSVRIQGSGLGGRHKMTCGFFNARN